MCSLSKWYSSFFIPLLLVITISTLVFINNVTGTRITFQQDKQTLELVKGILPGTDYYIFKEGIYYIYDGTKQKTSYAFVTKGNGVEGPIYILVVLQDEETIAGIAIISHHEKVGYSEVVLCPLDLSPLTKQFSGLKIIDCALKRNGGKMDGITGATFSSIAIIKVVKESIMDNIDEISFTEN
jgi:Na+-translocating ferredoxin:NAD+ oxidoreductase RnfG subunit